MQNKILKDFLEDTYDKNANYDSICSEIRRRSNMKKKISNIAAVVLIVIIVGALTPTIYGKIEWNIEYKEYQNRNVKSGYATIDNSIENGYVENLDMDYVYQNGIGIKIDSLLLTNDYCQMNINMKFDEKTQINTDTFSYGYVVYDENKNIYLVSERIHLGEKGTRRYWKKLYTELGINYDKKNVFAVELADSSNKKVITSEKGNIISQAQVYSSKGFPQSRKLYIRIFDIGFTMCNIDKENSKIIDAEDFCISDSEWNFEIDVPEKFYERESIELKLAEEIDGIVIEKAELTETGLVVKADIDGLRELIMSGFEMSSEEFENIRKASIFITDGDGNVYDAKDMGTLEDTGMKMRFDLGKDDLNKKIFLNVNLEGNKHIVELIQK